MKIRFITNSGKSYFDLPQVKLLQILPKYYYKLRQLIYYKLQQVYYKFQ